MVNSARLKVSLERDVYNPHYTALFLGLWSVFLEFPQRFTLFKEKRSLLNFSEKIRSPLTLNQRCVLFTSWYYPVSGIFSQRLKKKKKTYQKKKNLSKCMRLISEDLSRMSPEPKATEWKRKEGFLNGPHLLKTKMYRKRGEKSAVFMSCRQSTSARRECDY